MPDPQPIPQTPPIAAPPPAAPPPAVAAVPPVASTPPATPGPAEVPPAAPAVEPTLLGGEDPKPAEQPLAGVKPPEAEADVKFPENFKADAELVAGFKGLAKEIGLKGEAAQKAADFYVKAQVEVAKKEQANIQAMHAEWRKGAETDKEYGGADFKQNVQLASNAFKKFASTELQSFLVGSKLANHPEMVRLFYRLGKQDAEPGRVVGGSPLSNISPEEARNREMYPTMHTEKKG